MLYSLRKFPASGYSGCLLWFFLLTPAVAENDLAQITVSGEILKSAACVINNNQPVIVEMGEILISQLQPGKNLVPVKYSLQCESNVTPDFFISGKSAAFSASLLATTNENLGLRFYVRKSTLQPLALSEKLRFTYPDYPDLLVEPAGAPDKTLTAGEFNATATMNIVLP
ncbi:hypothetical protein C1Y43_16285 [Pantoea sp. ICBG 828]|uniref:fimbrial protein n=1 Tax=unclassified Pantoea TaxID=2630326 RepID=UPI000CE4B42B|nr:MULTISPECIES: fimbrial protein [unclassified Pantoea]NIG35733.1 fimbrial protein [Pantoea sp. Ap-959]PPC66331.1 hypothetical protein C1Y43_16285 [Pantoea sp. ICBG 828]